MVSYLHEISEAAFINLTEKFENVFSSIQELVELQQNREGEQLRARDETAPIKKVAAEKLREELEHNLCELPVIGFNSSKYSLNVIKNTSTKD